MGFYQERMLPCLTDLAMRQGRLTPYRSRVVRAATGRVLEIGIGSGLNLPFYSKGIAQVLGLDPSRKLLEMTRDAATRTSVPLEVIEGSAEDIPIDNRSIDTVVTTWTFAAYGRFAMRLRRCAAYSNRAVNFFLLNTGARRNRACNGGRITSPRYGNIWRAVAISIAQSAS